MLDLSAEATRVALMEQAGCDARCGLTWGRPNDGGEPVLSHHRREQEFGPSKNPTIATIYVAPEDFDLVAWIGEQHAEPDDE